jgi:hypothetical protein
MSLDRLRRAAFAFPADAMILAVLANVGAEPGMRVVGGVTVVRIGVLEDLKHLLARGVLA